MEVNTVLAGKHKTFEMPSTIWPPRSEVSNFRVAVPDRPLDAQLKKENEKERKNFAHSEYQLLVNNGLTGMLQTSNGEMCPEYVILYSKLLPCYKPATKPCSAINIEARKDLATLCGEEVNFYLYTTHETPASTNLDQKKLEFLKNSKIIWINPIK